MVHKLSPSLEEKDRHYTRYTTKACKFPVIPPTSFPKARIIPFQYGGSKIPSIDDLLNPETLEKYAKRLLQNYPLVIPQDVGHSGKKKSNGNHGPDDSPVIFIAHGFGGLIYEQALVLQYGANRRHGTTRKHAVLMLSTPHHGAGMGEWAIMCAKQLQIPCENTAEKQDWSRYEYSLEKIERMQRDFRRIIQNDVRVEIAGFCATTPDENNLTLAPEWAIPPEFKTHILEAKHFEIGRMDPNNAGFQRLSAIIHRQIDILLHGRGDETVPREPNALAALGQALGFVDVESTIYTHKPQTGYAASPAGQQSGQKRKHIDSEKTSRPPRCGRTHSNHSTQMPRGKGGVMVSKVQ